MNKSEANDPNAFAVNSTVYRHVAGAGANDAWQVLLITMKLDASPSFVGGLNTAAVGDRFVNVTVRSGVTDPLLGAPLKSSSPVESEMLTVAVGAGVGVGVVVALAVGVAVRVAVAVAIGVGVGVPVRVAVAVFDAVGVGVRVAVPAKVGVEVGVMPGDPSPDSSNIPRP